MTDDGEGRRPRVGVLGYGSILDPEEIAKVLDSTRSEVFSVKVEGFRRLFNQEASWREVDGPERAVLNVVQDENDWFNAVLIADLTQGAFRRFRERERGYQLVEVQAGAITPYESKNQAHIETQDLIVVATGEKTRDDIEPIQAYLDLCLRGANHWGDEFERDFINTTQTATGDPLSSCLDDR